MLELNFHPFPEIKTSRLVLRQISEEDAAEIFFLRSDPSVLRYLNKEPAKSIKEAKQFIKQISDNIDENEAVMWGITLKENPDTLIGTACFWNIRKEDYRADIGYVLHPNYWNKGIMKEALQQLIEYGYTEMKLHSIEANIHPGNLASAALLESLNFIKEAHFRENFYYKGRFEDTVVYSLVTK